MPPSAAPCSHAASTRPRPSTRPGSSPSPTPRPRSTAPSRPRRSPSTRPCDDERSVEHRMGVEMTPRVDDALRVLADQLRSEATPISPHVVDPPEAPTLGQLAASGPGSAAAPAEYAL